MSDSGRPQGNNVEAEKIRSQQKCLHISLKPEIAKLCEILLLPDNVKSMVGKILEYVMNNRQICAEPVAILQAFQLSLSFIAAYLLNHKLDIEASLILAKKHLNFDCKKNAVHQINAMLWDLREKFLLLKENSEVTGSQKAFESSTRVHSNAFITPYVESTETYFPELLENKNNLKKVIETKEDDFAKRLAELKRQHEVRLQAFETKMLYARQKFRESWTLDEVLETSRECTTSSTDQKSDSGEAAELSRPVNLIEPQEQVHLKPLSSVESPHSPIIHLPANKSNHVSMVAEPIEKMQQLPASNLEIGARTHRLVPPISNMVIDSHVSGVVNAPSSNTKNLSTQRVINDNHPIQTAVQSALRNVLPLCNDSFLN
ncbi:helicase protein MOM1 [Trifolium repens]|nr:helicase protein MOM1 [Trifolium repens]